MKLSDLSPTDVQQCFHVYIRSDTSIKEPSIGLKSLKPDLYGSAVAEQYAAVISAYWRALRRTGRLDPGRVLDVIDLCPDSCGALLMAAIQRRVHSMELREIRYLPWIGIEPSEIQIYRNREACLCGRIDIGARLMIHGLNEVEPIPYSSENPLIVIAHGAWGEMRQDLFAMHYGKLLRANLSLISSESTEESRNLWEPSDESCWDEALRSQLAYYRGEFNSSTLIYPRGALQALSCLRSIASEGSLVISCMTGCATDIRVRLTSFADVMNGYRESERLPVNLQLIASWTRSLGGSAREVDLSSRRVLQLLAFDHPDNAELLDSVLECIDPAVMDSASHLCEISRLLTAGVSLDARLNLLQMSKFEPSVFSSAAEDIVRAFRLSEDPNLIRWRDALDKVWEKHLLYPVDEMLYHWLAQAAMHCGHWGLARRALQHGLIERGENATDLANLGWCESRTGRLHHGLELVSRAVLLDGEHGLAKEVCRRLTDRLALRDTCWRVEIQHPELRLHLEPLDASHAHALSYQYRDEQIAVMTGLPSMSDPEMVRQWILESNNESGKVNFAVMHEDWGFVGFINLAVSGHAAFFCFWTGVDFQGKGFATAAGRLACQHAVQCGVPLMLTSAYKDNHRSIRALKRLGFQEIATRAAPPDHERIFFYLSDPSAGSYDYEYELVAYYRRENLPMEFNFPGDLSLPPVGELAVAGGKS